MDGMEWNGKSKVMREKMKKKAMLGIVALFSKALSDVLQKEVVLEELRHLVELEIVNLEEKDLDEIGDVLNSAKEWELNIKPQFKKSEMHGDLP